MITFLTICYCGVIWLVFFKLKIAPWNKKSQGIVVTVGVVALLALLIAINMYQPSSQDVRIYQPVVEIVPRVTGRVIEVPVKPDVPLKEGDVLFKVDPRPFQYTVNQLRAKLVETKGYVEQLEEVLKAATATVKAIQARLDLSTTRLKQSQQLVEKGAGSRYEMEQHESDVLRLGEELRAAKAQEEQAKINLNTAINDEQTAIAQVQAQLESAELSLAETVVYAPADGFVTNISLRPGQTAAALTVRPVMSFIYDEYVIIASFAQNMLQHIQPGDSAEIVLYGRPGKVFRATVDEIIKVTGQGQLPPSGTLMSFTGAPTPGRFAVRLTLDDTHDQVRLPAGAAGVAAIYTEKATMIRIIRKVILRITSWLNYLPG